MAKQRPIDTLRDGALKATIWKNHGSNGDFYAVHLNRIYTDERERIHETDSFSGAELLQVAELARRAYGRVREIRAADKA